MLRAGSGEGEPPEGPRARRPPPERVLYARSQRQALERCPVAGGEPLTQTQAAALREAVFGGSAAAPPARGSEWLRAELSLRPPDRELAFALAVPGPAGGAASRRCSVRALLAAVQAQLLRALLFPGPGRAAAAPPGPERPLRPSAAEQREALQSALTAVLWRCGAERGRCRLALPQPQPLWAGCELCLPDGLTERLTLFEAASRDELRALLRRFLYVFQEAGGGGCLLLLYSAVLSRGVDRVRADLDGALGSLLGPEDEGSACLVMLLLTGRATPYLHNGVLYAGDEDHYALPRLGALARAEVGLLLWAAGRPEEELPGSRLKTPSLPVWVCAAAGHYGVLFSTNRELLSNYHAERRFELHYYCFEGGSCLLGVDTRFAGEPGGGRRREQPSRCAVERVIGTKWEGAHVTWLKAPPNACSRLSA